MSESKCACWSWKVDGADDLDDLMDHGHRPGCEFRLEDTFEISDALDDSLAAEILTTYDEDE